MLRWPAQGVFDKQLVQRVRVHTGVDSEHLGGRRGPSDAEHWTSVGVQLGNRGSQGGGLARPCRAHDHHQLPRAGHRGGDLGLRRRQLHRAAVDDGDVVDTAGIGALPRPLGDTRLLSEDVGCGERPVDRRLGHRPSIPTQ